MIKKNDLLTGTAGARVVFGAASQSSPERAARERASGSGVPSVVESILNDVRRAFGAQLYYPALVVALTLPEICVGLTLKREQQAGRRGYIEFVDRYCTGIFGLSGRGCYQLRCGMVHRGSALGNRKEISASHVIFTVPETEMTFHGINFEMEGLGTALTIDLKIFCDTMEAAVRTWFAERRENLLIDANAPYVLSWLPEGLPPFINFPVVGCGVPIQVSETMFHKPR